MRGNLVSFLAMYMYCVDENLSCGVKFFSQKNVFFFICPVPSVRIMESGGHTRKPRGNFLLPNFIIPRPH